MAAEKIALITGANKGIGFEIARQLSQQGTFVLIGARDAARGKEVAASLMSDGLAVAPLSIDVTDPASVAGAARDIEEQHGRLDYRTVEPPGAVARCRREAQQRPEGSDVNYVLVMKNAQADLMAIGPVSIEYQAAMLRDQIEEGSDWTAVGIARVLTEAQARAAAGLPAPAGGGAQPTGAS